MADISLTKLTLGKESVEGTGVFDVMMAAADAHLNLEFTAGRIKGTDYASVYVQSMTATLQSAVQFLLGYEIANLQALLLADQIEGEKAKNLLLAEQKNKLKAEIDLLKQKLYTEQAQTLPGTYEAPTTIAVVDGIMGKQNTLYANQAAGFIRDAEQKAAKIMLDNWGIQLSKDSASQAQLLNGLVNGNIKSPVDALIAGIGKTPATVAESL
jgi:hypothetical protein